MSTRPVLRASRRGFLAQVGQGTLLATLGASLANDLGLGLPALAEESAGELRLGEWESLASSLQTMSLDKLQPYLAQLVKQGTALKSLVGAAALANARTFGGEDYIGFHTFMALAPALQMATLLPTESAPLPVFKVLYRNTGRMHEFGGRSAEVLHAVSTATTGAASGGLHEAIQGKDAQRAEQTLAALVATDRLGAFEALLPAVQDNPEVHRTVLPYRAWQMQEIVGTEHALTLLRQSLRYCVRAEPHRRAEWAAHGQLLAKLLDEYRLAGAMPGTKPIDDARLDELSRTFATASADDAARCAASALQEGIDPAAIGEAISLAASLLVLRDGGRLPLWEERLKPAGSVHGDSVGVHASDAANAWRNMARVTTARQTFACILFGAWQVARDRNYPGNLLPEPLPAKHHLDRLGTTDADGLLAKLNEAIQNNLQSHATAAVARYGQLGYPAERVFQTLLRYAVSEDGALHAEKYFHTVWDDFHATRSSRRWQHLVALARVTASEFGRPAAGQAEAREILGVRT